MPLSLYAVKKEVDKTRADLRLASIAATAAAGVSTSVDDLEARVAAIEALLKITPKEPKLP
jgi:hypothetical protein